MPALRPTFHMDANSIWRWYLTDSYGHPVSVSMDTFVSYEEAKMGYELACLTLWQAA